MKTPQVSEREVPVFFYTLYVQENEQSLIGRVFSPCFKHPLTLNSSVAEDEVTVHINILDINDNRPEFLTNENPVEISVSSYLEAGELIAKMEAWDSDLGDNADLRYSLSSPHATSVFDINAVSGDIVLNRPLINQVGKTFRLTVEARDRKGEGLTGSIQLVVYVLDSRYQLTMVLSNGVHDVTQDLANITRSLSSLMGYSVGAHHVEEHRNGGSGDDEEGGGTDIYVYAVEAQKLVKTEDMIKALSGQLQRAKSKLEQHGLLEVRAGAQTLAPQDEPSTSGGSLGSLEIAVLGMACAVFLGALIAVVSIFCIRIKRQSKTGYPAPLAIPLPSYTVDHPAPPPTVGILHNPFNPDVRRRSGSKKYFAPRSVNIDTSEETSDTNVDDHLEGSSNPASYDGYRTSATPKSSRSKARNAKSSRDSGIDERRESMSLTCSNCHQSSCESCSDDQEPPVRHHRQGSCSSAKFRRHKSASPSRRSGRQSSRSKYGERGHSQPRTPQESRSKSAGHVTHDCNHCCNCERRSRSNCCQQSNHCDCCFDDEGFEFSRYGKGSQSTRSTQWEVYRDVGSRSRSSSQRAKKSSKGFEVSPLNLLLCNCDDVFMQYLACKKGRITSKILFWQGKLTEDVHDLNFPQF